jgi:hypothetical protein
MVLLSFGPSEMKPVSTGWLVYWFMVFNATFNNWQGVLDTTLCDEVGQ